MFGFDAPRREHQRADGRTDGRTDAAVDLGRTDGATQRFLRLLRNDDHDVDDGSGREGVGLEGDKQGGTARRGIFCGIFL